MIFFLGNFSIVLHKNVCCGYSLEVPYRCTSNEYPQDNFFYGEIRKLLMLNKSSVHVN